MKQIVRSPVLFIVIFLFSCDRKNSEAPIFTIDQITELNNWNHLADDLKNSFNNFINHQKNIDIIDYAVTRIDTFINTNVWIQSGVVQLARNPGDSITGFSFYSKREDSNEDEFFLNNVFYEVHKESKYFVKKSDYGGLAFNSPGGRLVVQDLLKIDQKFNNFIFTKKENGDFQLSFLLNTGSVVEIKQLLINAKTLIPFRIRSLIPNINRNTFISTTWNFRNISINNKIITNQLTNPYFSSGFSYFFNPSGRKADAYLGKPFPAITLTTFELDSLRVLDLNHKVVLLDFWEWWCQPCIKSLPRIDFLSTMYDSYGLYALSVTSDDPARSLKIYNDMSLKGRIAIGTSEIKKMLRIDSVPRYFLIDRHGIVRAIYYGYSDILEVDINYWLLSE